MRFKIGDKVKYVGEYSSFVRCNAIGIIVRYGDCGWGVLFSDGQEWFCVKRNLVKILSKNQQLEFSFMRTSD